MVANISPTPSAASTRTEADRAARLALSKQEALIDAGLVRRFNAGEAPAFVQIVTRHREKMFHVAFGVLRNRADAEEIVQDTFIRAHRGLAQFRGDSTLAGWLYCIALNLSRNRYWYFFRRRRQSMRPLDAPLGESSTATLADVVASDAPSPVRDAVNHEFSAIVTLCTNQLPPGQRDILRLRNVQQHSYAQISRQLGINIGTAKSRIARARCSLRALLGKAYPEFGSPFACFESLRTSGRLEVA